MARAASEKSLSIGSHLDICDCRFTTFSIVRSQKGRPKRRSSNFHQHSYELSLFEIPHHQDRCERIGLYVALHKDRFHLVVSGSDDMAIAAIKSQIAAEEHTRQRLQWVHDRETALDAMTVRERSSCEAQYDEISRALKEWRGSARRFSSIKWNGQENSLSVNAAGLVNPCLLCETGATHLVPILRFDINGMLPNETKRFADGPIDMEAEITRCDLDTEAETPNEQTGAPSSRALLKRWIGVLQRGRAKAPTSFTLRVQNRMLTRTAELRKWIWSLGENLNRRDYTNNAGS